MIINYRSDGLDFRILLAAKIFILEKFLMDLDHRSLDAMFHVFRCLEGIFKTSNDIHSFYRVSIYDT